MEINSRQIEQVFSERESEKSNRWYILVNYGKLRRNDFKSEK